MAADAHNCFLQLDELLNSAEQMWLLGAGASKAAGVPLMAGLTKWVSRSLVGTDAEDFKSALDLLQDGAHVEHVLNHLADLIAIADRSRDRTALLGNASRTVDELRQLHAGIQSQIRDCIRWGYIAPEGDCVAEQAGTKDQPIVKVDSHLAFVRALFHVRRSGLDRRPPVALFTTNYDTLLEDALALSRVPTVDGFSGGAMAFWNPDDRDLNFFRPFAPAGSAQAKIYKLHGSIDWLVSEADIVVRRRDGVGYPNYSSSHLLIYPQATKYALARRDPFAGSFAAFRSALTEPTSGLFAVCGYSFGDEHINDEIDRAFRQRRNNMHLVAFVKQPPGDLPDGEGLPVQLARWLHDAPWRGRLLVAGSRSLYHGSLERRCTDGPAEHAWWSFDGLTGFLKDGPGALK